MADAVSKLYAEIGFKVNTKGLEDAQKALKDLAKEISKVASAVNKSLKEEEKRLNGVIKLRQKELSETVDANKKLVADHKKKNAEILKSDQELNRNEKKLAREREQDQKIASNNISKLWRGLKKSGNLLLNKMPRELWKSVLTAYSWASPAMERSIDFRDFSFETGMGLEDFQKYARLFAGSGIGMSAKDIMKDILGVQRNLTNIALGGGNLEFYKLLDVREAARRNDIAGVIKGIIAGVQRNEIDKSMLVELLGRAGISNAPQWAMMIDRNPQMAERLPTLAEASLSKGQMGGIQRSQESINTLVYAFEVLRDQIVSALSPTIKMFADFLTETFSNFAKYLKENSQAIQERLKKYGEAFINFLKSINWESFGKKAKTVIGSFLDGVEKAAEYVGVLADVIKPIAFVLDVIYSSIKAFGEFFGGWVTNAYLRADKGQNGVRAVLGGLWDTLKQDNSATDDFFRRWVPGSGRTVVINDNSTLNQNINGVEQEEIAETTANETKIRINQRYDQIKYGYNNTFFAGY